jgi:hypothetical protein
MTTLIDRMNTLKGHIDNAFTEIEYLEGGKKAAAPRARKSLQEVKKLSHELRKGVIEHLNTLKPVKAPPAPIELEAPEVKRIMADISVDLPVLLPKKRVIVKKTK